MNIQVKITKAKKIIGEHIILRDARPDDAAFIVETRTHEKKSRFISQTSSDTLKQKEWLEKYSNCDDQAYFIITDKNDIAYGTVRLYDAKGTSFCWGSWVIKDNAPTYCAIESALLVYYYALNLGFKSSHFDVRKGNESVINFHKRFGADLTGETDLDYLFEIKKEKIECSFKKYKKFMAEKIKIIK